MARMINPACSVPNRSCCDMPATGGPSCEMAWAKEIGKEGCKCTGGFRVEVRWRLARENLIWRRPGWGRKQHMEARASTVISA